jgi:4-methyl-5(b-hydroxyethyl)-thiazole monophosphate biosynthesis
MKKKALVILSEGFEDIEAVASIDVLTRSGVEVTTVSATPGPVRAAYGSVLVTHTSLETVAGLFDAIVLPGGLGNAGKMAANRKIVDLVKVHDSAGKLVAAICASPALVLGEAARILHGRRATGYPDINDRLAASGAIVTHEHVTADGNLVTGMGPGSALLFALRIAEYLVGPEVPNELASRWRISR